MCSRAGGLARAICIGLSRLSSIISRVTTGWIGWTGSLRNGVGARGEAPSRERLWLRFCWLKMTSWIQSFLSVTIYRSRRASTKSRPFSLIRKGHGSLLTLACSSHTSSSGLHRANVIPLNELLRLCIKRHTQTNENRRLCLTAQIRSNEAKWPSEKRIRIRKNLLQLDFVARMKMYLFDH